MRDPLPTTAGLSTLWRVIARLGFTEKKTVHADEHRRPDVVAARRPWHTWQPLRDMDQSVFLDECGVTTDLLRRYGRSPSGVRLRDHTPCSDWETHTVVAALRLDGLGAPAVFNGPIDTPTFLAYVEQVLVPTLRRGDKDLTLAFGIRHSAFAIFHHSPPLPHHSPMAVTCPVPGSRIVYTVSSPFGIWPLAFDISQ